MQNRAGVLSVCFKIRTDLCMFWQHPDLRGLGVWGLYSNGIISVPGMPLHDLDWKLGAEQSEHTISHF